MAGIRRVEAVGVVKDYGRTRALGGVSLALRAGQLTALLGDNGAGKSTLLAILATLSRPTRGRVLYDGVPRDELDQEALRAELGVLAHEPRCYADLTARENLIFFGRLAGGAVDVDAMLGRVGLLPCADQPVRTFSRGMVQRLALARTLLSRPSLLLLDEPFTGLDRKGVALLGELLLAELDRGAVVLLTSHDLDAVAPLCDRALLLRRGRIAGEQAFERGSCRRDDLAALYSRLSGAEKASP